MNHHSLNFKFIAAHGVAILLMGCLLLPQARADEGPLTENHKNALKICSAYAQGTFLRALERKHFKFSAQHHAAVQKDNPGEGTAKKIHEMIEIVYQFPKLKPHELAIVGYVRCMGNFADSFWAYEK